MVSPQPKLPSSCPKLPSSLNEATVVRYLGQTCLPSSRGDSFGDHCTKTRKGTSLSFWCKVYNASAFLCSKFERDRWSQRGASRQKLLEASGRVGAILTTVASRGCPQCSWRTVSALTRVLFWYVFPSLLRNSGNKHQNNPLVSAETIRHSGSYIILSIYNVITTYIYQKFKFHRSSPAGQFVPQKIFLSQRRHSGCLSNFF